MITWTHGRNPLFPTKSPKNWLNFLGKPFHAMVSLGKASRYEPKIRARDKDLGALRVGIPQGVEIRATWTSSFLCDSPSIFVLRDWLGSQNQKWYKQIYIATFSISGYHWWESPVDRIIWVGFQIWISKTWNLLVSGILESLKPEICWFPHFETPSYDDRFKAHSSQSRLCTSLKFIFSNIRVIYMKSSRAFQCLIPHVGNPHPICMQETNQRIRIRRILQEATLAGNHFYHWTMTVVSTRALDSLHSCSVRWSDLTWRTDSTLLDWIKTT